MNFHLWAVKSKRKSILIDASCKETAMLIFKEKYPYAKITEAYIIGF